MQSNTFLIISNLIIRIKMIYGYYSGVSSFFTRRVWTDNRRQTNFLVPHLKWIQHSSKKRINNDSITNNIFWESNCLQIFKSHSSQKHCNGVQTKQTSFFFLQSVDVMFCYKEKITILSSFTCHKICNCRNNTFPWDKRFVNIMTLQIWMLCCYVIIFLFYYDFHLRIV